MPSGQEAQVGIKFALTNIGAVYAELDNRSEEHTSELQSPCNLVCRLLLEKKKQSNQIVGEPYHKHLSRRWHNLAIRVVPRESVASILSCPPHLYSVMHADVN